MVQGLEREKFIAKHQVQGNGPDEVRVGVAIAQIDEVETVAFGELLSRFQFPLKIR
jgi:hypothetical protein